MLFAQPGTGSPTVDWKLNVCTVLIISRFSIQNQFSPLLFLTHFPKKLTWPHFAFCPQILLTFVVFSVSSDIGISLIVLFIVPMKSF